MTMKTCKAVDAKIATDLVRIWGNAPTLTPEQVFDLGVALSQAWGHGHAFGLLCGLLSNYDAFNKATLSNLREQYSQAFDQAMQRSELMMDELCPKEKAATTIIKYAATRQAKG